MTLTSASRILIPTRGILYAFAGIPGFNPRKLIMQLVTIDEAVRRVKGVETFCVGDATGMSFGLLVDTIPPSLPPA